MVTVVCAASVCATSLIAQSEQVAGSWKVVQSPNGGSQAAGNAHLATAALSSTDAWAVGAEPNPDQYLTATLAEHWDGTQWSIVSTALISAPTVQLNSIAIVTSSDIWRQDIHVHCLICLLRAKSQSIPLPNDLQ